MFFLLMLLALAGSYVITAWTFMLTVGIIHLHWIPQLHTLGYGWALVITMVATLPAVIGGFVSGALKN